MTVKLLYNKMTKINNFDSIYALEYSKGYLNKKIDHPLFVWELGEDINHANEFLNDLKQEYPDKQFMLVREIEFSQ